MKLDKSYKVRVTPEQSRKIQELAFELGFEWYFSGKQILHTEISNLTLGINCMVLGCFENTKNFYADTRFTEISADDIIALLTDLLKSAENPLQGVELTPEFEAVEPKFKVGDKVYYPSFSHEICTIKLGVSDDLVTLPNDDTILATIGTDLGFSYNDKEKIWEWGCEKSAPAICHATQENYELLSKLYPHIEFEQSPKPLTGIELAKKLIAKGHNYLVVDTVIGIRVLTRLEGNTLIDSNNVRLDELDDITPLDDITGEPLTESILND